MRLEAESLAPNDLPTKSPSLQQQDYEFQIVNLRRRVHRNDRHQYYRKKSREKGWSPCHHVQKEWWMKRIETLLRVSEV